MVRAQDVLEAGGSVAHRRPQPGDYRWDGSLWRRWSGRRWARAAYSLHPERLSRPTRLDEYPAIDDTRSRRVLAKAVEDQVATNGATVVYDGPSGVVLGYRRPVSHGLHAIGTFLTGGLWGIVWIVATLARKQDRARLEIDPWGNVWATYVVATS